MYVRRGTCLVGLLVAATLLPAQTVMAGLPKQILNGLTLIDYGPSGKFGSYYTKNYLGKGWDFDTNATYTGQTYRFGLANLTLGATSPSNVAVSSGYTLRGVPEARFSMKTAAPLSYTLNTGPGLRTLTATGDIGIDVDTTINALGFYDMTFQISNRGTYTTNGPLGKKEGSLDFDAGRIDVSGNIFADAFAALTQPIFTAAGTENPFTKLSQKSARSLPEGMDLNSITDLTAASNDQIGQAVNNAILSTLLGQEPSTNLFSKLILPENLQLSAVPLVEGRASPQQVPEPTTVALIALGLAVSFWPRRRRTT